MLALLIAAALVAPFDPLAAAVRPPPPVRLSLAPAAAEAYALKRAGLARTAVERRADGATLAAGFLCGLKDSADRSGAATAVGSDPHGRFVGAKLTFSFR